MTQPESTYRLQLNKDFTFYDAARIAPYLHALGITHLYLSPVFESTPGSMHGYDVTDPLKISEERGGRTGLNYLDRVMTSLNPPLKMILDIVPNHMAASCHNPYWYDILQKGKSSEHWTLFDLRVQDGQKLQIPVLGETLKALAENGNLTLDTEDGEKRIKLFDMHYPVCADTKADTIEDLLNCQHYELVDWAAVFKDMSYRRFFDITGLVGVRVEDAEIYQKTHDFIFKLKDELPSLDGVRVDHIDGLCNPAAYLQNLHQTFNKLWIEKILAPDEGIPSDWMLSGTTGYEFIDILNRLFTNPEGYESIHTLWQSLTNPDWRDFDDCVHHAKEIVLENLFPVELKRLSSRFDNQTLAQDFWRAMTVSLPVYRTYFDGKTWSENDQKFIDTAKLIARERYKTTFDESETYMESVFTNPEQNAQTIFEWQQLTGPAMAKGLEDTAHYRYTPLLSFNEVGCAPNRPLCAPADFLNWMTQRLSRFPDSFNATSTHDTKRSEDTRHRLWALSNIPMDWYETVKKLIAINDQDGISTQFHYFVYQTLISVWPVNGGIDTNFETRMTAYFSKAINESKVRTSWVSPDKDYEEHIQNFILKTLHNPKITAEIEAIVRQIAPMGAILSCAVLALKTMNSGIPDFYQGTESWCFDLVDPDNRRPIDYSYGQKTLEFFQHQENRPELVQDLCQNWTDGRVKIWLTKKLLTLRKDLDLTSAPVMGVVEGPGKGRVLSYKIKDANAGDYYLITLPLRFLPGEDFKIPNDPEWNQTALQFHDTVHLYDCIMDRDVGEKNFLPLTSAFKDFPISILRLSAR